MEPTIKIDLERIIAGDEPVIVELGCGKKKKPGHINIDRLELPNVDIVADLEEGLSFLPDSSADRIYCKSLLEHIENLESLIREIVRVLKNQGTAHITVPHFSNPYQFSDYTHRRLFGLYTFYYFTDTKNQMKRKVPDFYSDIRIKIISQRLIFKSPFWLKRQFGKLLGLLFNCCKFMQEFYEANLCYIFPCYAIETVFTPSKNKG